MDIEAARRVALLTARAVLAAAAVQFASGIVLALGFHNGFRTTVSAIASRVDITTALLLLVGAVAVAVHDADHPTRSRESTWVRLIALLTCALDLALIVVVAITEASSFAIAPNHLRTSSILADALAPAVLAACAFTIANRRFRAAGAADHRDIDEDELWAQLDPQ